MIAHVLHFHSFIVVLFNTFLHKYRKQNNVFQ